VRYYYDNQNIITRTYDVVGELNGESFPPYVLETVWDEDM
jgi:hypothetical protein